MLPGLIKKYLLNFHKENSDSSSDAARKTADKWARSEEIYINDGFKIFWETLDAVQAYQDMMIFDGEEPEAYVFSFFPEEKKLNNLRCLNIGCNFGEDVPLVKIAKTGLFSKIMVVDISEELLARQSEITDALGLNGIFEYRCMDLNKDMLRGENIYDFIFSLGTIHHIESLEKLFEGINRVLKKDGIFCMREYVGPSFLQFREEHVELINEMLERIPESLRRDRNGIIKSEAWRPTMEEIFEDDPSEAVRSADILDVAPRFLNIIESRGTGGTLLDSLLHGIAGNFENSRSGERILETLIHEEKELVEKNIIPSYYIFLIAKKMAVRQIKKAQTQLDQES